MRRYCGALVVMLLLTGRPAFALDPAELATLTDAVKEMCVHPDRTGDYLKTEGEVKFGAPVLFKILNGDLSGTVSYEKWQGISITADKYKTDPRECAIKLLEILKPALASPETGNAKIIQSVPGIGGSNSVSNKGTINTNVNIGGGKDSQ